MKLSEMNSNERMVWEIAVENVNDYIGGFENDMEDWPEDSEEYKTAKNALSLSHEELIDVILSWCRSDRRWQRIENLHFVGIEFMRERISKRLTKYGY